MRVLRGLSFEQLPCGCLAGIYETHGGDVVTIIDARAAECPDTTHLVDVVMRRRRPAIARRAGLAPNTAVRSGA